MGTITTILLVIAIIIVLIFVLASFSSNTYTIERRITINQPNDKVFNYVKLLEHQNEFNKWVMTDPHVIRTFKGVDGEKGAVVAWESNISQVGKGEQEITGIKPDSRIDYEIRFEKPFKGVSTAYMTTTPTSGNQTAVNWVFQGKRNLIMKVFHMLFNLKKVLGNDMATSLDRLKAVLEK
jgi:uncharacterized protein YndB with AHSA1/START domain